MSRGASRLILCALHLIDELYTNASGGFCVLLQETSMLATVARIMVKILRVSCFMTKHERVADEGDDVNSPRRLPMLAMPSFGVADPLRVFPSPTPLRVATSSTLTNLDLCFAPSLLQTIFSLTGSFARLAALPSVSGDAPGAALRFRLRSIF